MVALTATRSAAMPQIVGDARRASPRDAGRSAAPRRSRHVEIGDAAAPRAARGRPHARGSDRDAAPFHCGSEGGKWAPISPSPQAPSSASVSACSATSASEWPTRPRVMRDRDAAERHCVARPEGVDVIAVADADVAESASAASPASRSVGRRDIPRLVSFMLPGSPATIAHRHARPFGDRRIVGEDRSRRRRRRSMRGQDRREAEALRRLRGIEPVARDRCRRPARRRSTASACRRPAGRHAASALVERADHPVDQRRVDEGPRRVMDQHARRARSARAPRAQRAPSPGGSRRRSPAASAGCSRDAAAIERCVVVGDDDDDRSDAGMRQERVERPREDGTAADGRYCFGTSAWPARSPRPAATIRAATVDMRRTCALAWIAAMYRSRRAAAPWMTATSLRACVMPQSLTKIWAAIGSCLMNMHVQHRGSRIALGRRRSRSGRCDSATASSSRRCRASPTSRSARSRTRFGAGLVVSEMVASEQLAQGDTRSGDARRARRPGPSTWSSSPAARRTGWPRARDRGDRAGADIIDINMGCPAKKVTGGYSGSALMRDLDHALSPDRGDGRRRRRAGDAEDAARLGRGDRSTRPSSRAAPSRPACSWSPSTAARAASSIRARPTGARSARVKEAVSIPVIANGDIVGRRRRSRRCSQRPAPTAVMIGRGAYGAPWSPAHVAAYAAAGRACRRAGGAALAELRRRALRGDARALRRRTSACAARASTSAGTSTGCAPAAPAALRQAMLTDDRAARRSLRLLAAPFGRRSRSEEGGMNVDAPAVGTRPRERPAQARSSTRCRIRCS